MPQPTRKPKKKIPFSSQTLCILGLLVIMGIRAFLYQTPFSISMESESTLETAQKATNIYNEQKIASAGETTVSTTSSINGRESASVNTSTWPTWWSIARKDRSGAVVHDMLRAHAYAFAHNRTYGGACICCPQNPNKHKKAYQQKPIVEALLKEVGWDDALKYGCPDEPKYSMPELIDDSAYRDADVTKRWSPQWQRFIRPQLQKGISSSDKQDLGSRDVFQIGVHIRRGDVTPCKLDFRYLPNSHYLRLIKKYTPNDNDPTKVQVHIYSQNVTFEDFLPDFEDYTLHLDTPLAQVWKGLLESNVMLLSRSSFSYVPALLSSPDHTEVVYTDFFEPPLSSWMVVANASSEETQRLKDTKCVKKERTKKGKKTKGA